MSLLTSINLLLILRQCCSSGGFSKNKFKSGSKFMEESANMHRMNNKSNGDACQASRMNVDFFRGSTSLQKYLPTWIVIRPTGIPRQFKTWLWKKRISPCRRSTNKCQTNCQHQFLHFCYLQNVLRTKD